MRRVLPIAILITAAGLTGALALEPQSVFARYQEFLAKYGMEATLGSAQAEDEDSILLRDVEIRRDGDAPLRIGTIRLDGVAELPAGGFRANTVVLDGVAAQTRESDGTPVEITIEGARGSGIRLPSPDGGEPLIAPGESNRFGFSRLSVSADGREKLSVSGVSSTLSRSADGDLISAEFAIQEIRAAASELPPGVRAQAQALGLDGLSWRFLLKAGREVERGRLTLEALRLEAPGAGAIVLSMTLDGFTPDVMARIDALAANEKPDPTDFEAKEAAREEMMEALGRLRLASAKLSFEGGKLTRDALAMQAEAMGMTEQEAIAAAGAAARAQLEPLAGPAFAEEAAQAVTAFLADPQSLSLAFSPPQPIALTDIVGSALVAPGSLIVLLGAQVAANGD